MIEVSNLRKEYGELVAVDGVSLCARQGEIFGLLGPNGAGKSTTIGCISGLLKPSAGHVKVLGHDVVTDGLAARAQLGIVPQELALYEDLNARQNLSYWGAAYELRGSELKTRVQEVLEICGLVDRADEAVKKFSGGMKRRLNFGCGIVHRPKVILLDEPTVGVDPQSRVRLLDLVREEASRGVTVLYTTHYMEEAQELCNQLAIMDHGKVVAAGTLAELRGMMGERDLIRLLLLRLFGLPLGPKTNFHFEAVLDEVLDIRIEGGDNAVADVRYHFEDVQGGERTALPPEEAKLFFSRIGESWLIVEVIGEINRKVLRF